jgi:hypothetical protein
MSESAKRRWEIGMATMSLLFWPGVITWFWYWYQRGHLADTTSNLVMLVSGAVFCSLMIAVSLYHVLILKREACAIEYVGGDTLVTFYLAKPARYDGHIAMSARWRVRLFSIDSAEGFRHLHIFVGSPVGLLAHQAAHIPPSNDKAPTD